MKMYILSIGVATMLLSGCGNDAEKTLISATPTATATVSATLEPTPFISFSPLPSMTSSLQKPLPSNDDNIAIISTNKGNIVIRFFPEEAPKAVENFTKLAEKGYYNGVIFHRVINKFMIQGGDPTGTGRGGESIFGKVFENETSAKVKNLRGSIAMANAGANTNGSQFYINHNDNLFLDGGYTVFGEVIEGIDTVDAIATSKTDSADKPVDTISIKTVEIKKYSEYQK